ncbi:MAG: tripartite tricarboxylate transporter substrate binding protein [Betaproteobacteria bacterium]|nr:tripartite tricarboxylate transporter substrate binding protein [Betaproteobacteria bacterium]
MRAMTKFVLFVFLAASAAVCAQEYPARPIRLIVAFAPGGVVDTAARVLASKMTERLGWQFVVDNRTGSGGLIAGNIAAKAAPDGYTLLLAHTGEFAINQWIFRKIPFDVERDFVPITMVNDGPMVVVVNSKSPISSFKDLVAAAKAKPGEMSYGSPGSGAVNHLATEWLAAAAGIKLHHVPYKGGAPAVTAVSQGEVMLTVAGVPGVLPHLQAGRVKALGVTTAKRWDFAKDWPTPQEAGISGVDASIWTGLFAPRGVPKPVIDRLYKEVAATLSQPDVKERYGKLGSEPVSMTPAQFQKRVKQDAERYKKIVETVGIQAQ